MSKLKPRKSERTRRPCRGLWGIRGSVRKSGPPLGPGAQCACLPAPPPSAAEPISAAGICWPISGPRVPFQQQPDLVYLKKNRKLGSARNQNTPFLSPGLEDTVMVLGTGHGTACGVGALQPKPGRLGHRRLAEGLGLIGWACSGLALRRAPRDQEHAGKVGCQEEELLTFLSQVGT